MLLNSGLESNKEEEKIKRREARWREVEVSGSDGRCKATWKREFELPV